MEMGIHQPLKNYAGGLGYLAGSHMRSAFQLRQNLVGISILWKYGYYNQVRKQDQQMDVLFEEKNYGFLEPTDIRFTVTIARQEVWVTAYYLPPRVFNTAPVFFLSTDLPENDYLSKTVSHRLYDANPETRIAASILLGRGGAILLEKLGWEADTFHMNESHGLPLAFHLLSRHNNVSEVRRRLVFTNHTPEASGNQRIGFSLLEKMGFFCDLPLATVKAATHIDSGELDYTLAALRLSGKANAVSRRHLYTLQTMWEGQEHLCEIISITNAQDFPYWHNASLYRALENKDDEGLRRIKQEGKRLLFEEVADQCGEIYDDKICTLVFAKRFAGYKRPDLFFHDMERFHRLVTNRQFPVQIIWAGKPYPMDYAAIGVFDKIVDICKTYSNCSILCGYELRLSRLLKAGADLWLNVPRMNHEASGTSGMSAAMNGAVNLALPDGWFPEFARNGENSFVIPPGDLSASEDLQDDNDAAALFSMLETEVLPLYYQDPDRWLGMVKSGMRDIVPSFDSKRMAAAYYDLMYIGL
jgi:starch phosphorylase